MEEEIEEYGPVALLDKIHQLQEEKYRKGSKEYKAWIKLLESKFDEYNKMVGFKAFSLSVFLKDKDENKK